LWAGGISRGAYEVWGALSICLTERADDFGWDSFLDTQSISAPLLAKWGRPKAIHLPIKDYGTPPFPAEFWPDLTQTLLDMSKVEPLDVIVVCMGGHGRTGTVVSILAFLLGLTNYEDPIRWLRRVYCENAVESEKQAKYVYEVCGFPMANLLGLSYHKSWGQTAAKPALAKGPNDTKPMPPAPTLPSLTQKDDKDANGL
jgi:hypothetical protein